METSRVVFEEKGDKKQHILVYASKDALITVAAGTRTPPAAEGGTRRPLDRDFRSQVNGK